MSRIRRAVLVVLGFALGLPVSAPDLHAAPQQVAVPEEARTAPLDQPTPLSPELVAGRLPNGLTYYVRENHEPENRAELRLVVKAGSVLEDDDQLGLAHVLEHMAFNGTEHFRKHELLDFMESIGMRLGPDVNAYTSFDETVFMLQVPTDSAQLMATAFQILEDWSHALSLETPEIEQERGVVIEEWRLGRGAAARLRDAQLPVVFRGSRYAERLPIGTPGSLRTFDPEALRRFYRDWYRPDLMAVIAVGDFDPGDIEALVHAHFDDLPAPTDPRPRPTYDVPDHEETLFAIAGDPEMPQTTVSVYHGMPYEDDWTIGGYRQRIVESLHGAMLNARLAELARRPDPPFLGAAAGKARLVGSEGVYQLTALVPEGGVERGLEALFTEAERVQRFGFTASELEREKTSVLRGMERSYANRDDRPSGSFASEYLRAFLYGESTPGIEYEHELYLRFVPWITLDEVNQVGRDWIHDDNRVVLVSAPEKEGVPLPEEEELLGVMAAARRADVTPYEDLVSERPLLAEVPRGSEIVATRAHAGDITEWELANGVRVFVKPTEFQEDQVLVSSFSPGGTSLASDEDFVSADVATSVIAGGGLGEFDLIALRKKLSGKVAAVNPYVQRYEEGLSGSASPADLETLFQLIYMRFTRPRADEQFFQVWLTQNRRALGNREADPGTVFRDTFTRIVTQDHPRARPPSPDMLDQVDLDKAMAFYRDRFGDASDQVFVFVGNIDLEAMRPLVERYLGGLPVTGREESWRDVGIRPPTGVIEETVRKGLEPRSLTRLAFNGPFDFESRQDRTTIAAMALTLETRLQDVLREELGGTYGVNVGASTDWQPEGRYSLTISFGSDPARADEMVAAIFREIEALKADGPTEGQVADTRETLLRAHETNLEQNLFWRDQIHTALRRGLEPTEELSAYPATVRALTPPMVQAAARDYFDTGNYVRVTLVPEDAGLPASAGASRPGHPSPRIGRRSARPVGPPAGR